MAAKTATQGNADNGDKQIRDSEGHEKGNKPNINTISREDLLAAGVTGMSERRCNAIIDYRESHGDFASMKAVEKVPMIGHTMEVAMEDHFICEPSK